MNFAGLSIVLSTHPAQFEAVAFKGDLAANLARIAGWGYDGVELAIRDPDLVNEDLLEELVDSYKLKVPAIGTGQAWGEEHLSFTDPDPSVREAAMARIKRHIATAQRFNALVIIGLIRGVTPPGQSIAQSMRYLVDCMRDCAETAAAHQVHMALEPLNRYETDLLNTVQEGLEIIDQVGSASLGLLLDTFHMNIEESDLLQCILQAGKNIYHFHVADSNRWYPGAGHLDFRRVLDTLISVGYHGWISGEFMPLPDAITAAQLNISYLKGMLG